MEMTVEYLRHNDEVYHGMKDGFLVFIDFQDAAVNIFQYCLLSVPE